ncbi:amidase family protein [Bacillus sp. FJAT-49736]|uniref:amidase family protein n=1 Tax=Bacillus sp. FJAT-49736 TaxID=2833582 RepID=UPI001BC9E7A1|nr:amidase family protein [Bacillus sp. FJAT-49736]MBS4174976.1 amidase [Bacillus sp. FJAT-49736]
MKNPRLIKIQQDWLIEATIDEMQEKMENGEITSKELVLMYLDRIAQFDKNGPKINSVLEINPDALQIAAGLDAERIYKGPRGPLHGIPILIKDNIDTFDKMHTSAGSLALADSVAKQDSFVAKLLREAGAVILGKTNMTEWANFMANNMPSGYSSRGGQVLNPYGPEKFDVGGSSSGSGAAIAANLAAAAIGTETSGSILNPATQNSLVGIKPTVGLISRSGIIPIAHSQDTAGPMARTVKDAAILLSALTKQDSNDAATLTNTKLSDIDFTSFLQKDSLNGARIGVAREWYFQFLNEEKLEIINHTLDIIAECGAVLSDISIPSAKAKWKYDVLTYEFKADVNAYLRQIDSSLPVRSLKDLIEFNQKDPEAMLKYGQAVLEESEATSGTLTELDYVQALEEDIYLSTEQGIDYALQEHGVDAIIFPQFFGASIAAKAGYPSITVPAGYTKDGEPVSITFTGTAYSEPILLKLSYAFEQATKARKAPELTTTVEIK